MRIFFLKLSTFILVSLLFLITKFAVDVSLTRKNTVELHENIQKSFPSVDFVKLNSTRGKNLEKPAQRGFINFYVGIVFPGDSLSSTLGHTVVRMSECSIKSKVQCSPGELDLIISPQPKGYGKENFLKFLASFVGYYDLEWFPMSYQEFSNILKEENRKKIFWLPLRIDLYEKLIVKKEVLLKDAKPESWFSLGNSCAYYTHRVLSRAVLGIPFSPSTIFGYAPIDLVFDLLNSPLSDNEIWEEILNFSVMNLQKEVPTILHSQQTLLDNIRMQI